MRMKAFFDTKYLLLVVRAATTSVSTIIAGVRKSIHANMLRQDINVSPFMVAVLRTGGPSSNIAHPTIMLTACTTNNQNSAHLILLAYFIVIKPSTISSEITLLIAWETSSISICKVRNRNIDRKCQNTHSQQDKGVF